MRREALAVQSEQVGATIPITGELGVGRACFHCGEPCPEAGVNADGKSFCCQGCRVVHDLLVGNGAGNADSDRPTIHQIRSPSAGINSANGSSVLAASPAARSASGSRSASRRNRESRRRTRASIATWSC